MRLSTKLAHAKLRIKHKLLRLRLQQPLYYKTLATLVLMVAAGGMVAAYFLFLAPQDPVSYADQFEIIIESHSMNGKIVSVDGNAFKLEGAIVETKDGVSSVKTVVKTVIFTDATPIYVTQINGNEVNSQTGTATDVSPSKNITVYSPDNPAQSQTLNATKLEIIQ